MRDEYRQRELKRAADMEKFLTAVTAEMDEWSLVPIDPDKTDDSFAPRFREIQNADGSRKIMCEVPWNAKDRYRFVVWHWPHYTDDTGRKITVTPRDTYPLAERQQSPETTARADREPRAIARQIERKILSDYDRLWNVCAECAASSQKHYDRKANAIERLAEATGNKNQSPNFRNSFYVQDLPGDTVRVEFRSEGDCELHLSTDETIAVIAMLRELRAES